ncbi:MAG: zf-TFIIB domain-containing protein [Candidatus Electrothrix sp. Rat3]|nr:zf-TFIIB domain-containing protein [Candidatus Electrothrix rattekaaiensis]
MEKQCPCCPNVTLRKAIRRGVEIDYCPDCNGIWLDNGELSKIVTESVHASETESSPPEISVEASRKSVFKSFLNLMGSTKDDADNGFDDGLSDNSGDDSSNNSSNNSDSDFISESNKS